MRDLMLPLLWVNGWLGSDFIWRGNPMSSVVSAEEPADLTRPSGA